MNQKSSGTTRWTGLAIATVFLLFAYLGLAHSYGRETVRAEDTSSTYLPLIYQYFTPTPTPIPNPPQFVTEVMLPDALCPSNIGVNPTSGIVYVGNTESDNISILKNNQFHHSIHTGYNPTGIAPVTGSHRTYIANQEDHPGEIQISVFDDENLVTQLPDIFEPYDVVYNPVNGYVYITDLSGYVRVYDADTMMMIGDIDLPGDGWPLTVTVDPETGLVYVGTWEYRHIFIISDLTIINTLEASWGIRKIVLDPVSGYFYVAHSDPNATYGWNIAVFHRDDYTMSLISTASKSWDVDVDPIGGFAYFTNSEANTVTVMHGRQVLGDIPVDNTPWGVVVNPNTGYAFVANRESNTLSILKDGTFVRTDHVGVKPWDGAVNPETNDVYIIYRNYRIEVNDVGTQHLVCREPSVGIYR